MKTEPLTPEAAGLSLAILSGPIGAVRENWPCIEFTVELLRGEKAVWFGPYRLGVGHVKPLSYDLQDSYRYTKEYRSAALTSEEQNLSHHWARGATFKKDARTLQLQADTAAKLAKAQKVAPKLDDVCASLLSDGSAYFDAQSFEDWCADLCYSSDSIKARETFEECDKIGRALKRALTKEQIEGLREWASSH